jgi:hypothetical protein
MIALEVPQVEENTCEVIDLPNGETQRGQQHVGKGVNREAV